MLRLVFTICMIDAPGTCEQREMLVYDDIPVMACMMGAMPELASWQQTHPNWRIARWRCEDDGATGREARQDGVARQVSLAARLDVTVPAPVPIAASR